MCMSLMTCFCWVNVIRNMQAMVKEMTLPFSFKTERKMRFGILKRHATTDKDMMMFEADRAMMLWHTANAWEEGDLIHLLVCGMSDVSPPPCTEPQEAWG